MRTSLVGLCSAHGSRCAALTCLVFPLGNTILMSEFRNDFAYEQRDVAGACQDSRRLLPCCAPSAGAAGVPIRRDPGHAFLAAEARHVDPDVLGSDTTPLGHSARHELVLLGLLHPAQAFEQRRSGLVGRGNAHRSGRGDRVCLVNQARKVVLVPVHDGRRKQAHFEGIRCLLAQRGTYLRSARGSENVAESKGQAVAGGC